MERIERAELTLQQWEESAARLLRELGLCPFRRGDQLLCQALALAAERPERLVEGIGPLCAELAEKRGGTPTAVERSIRRSLDQLWQRGDRLTLRGWFPRLDGGRRPGSAAYLTILARQVRAAEENL
ncbi:MAG: sporulation initiation factor Spo0A C-terminal domain-containing protein [Candidatus Onthomonas sp.]